MNMINSRLSTSIPSRLTPLRINIGACYVHIVPFFLRRMDNIALRGLEFDSSRPRIGAPYTRHSLLQHLAYPHTTLADLAITEHDSFHTDQNPRVGSFPFGALCRPRVPASVWFNTRVEYDQGVVWRKADSLPFVTVRLPDPLQSLRVDFIEDTGFLAVDPG
jgi:hypothetical protein